MTGGPRRGCPAVRDRLAASRVGVLVGASLLLVAACGTNAGRNVVVSFRIDPTTHLPDPAAVAAARSTCPGSSLTPAQPAPTSHLLSVRQHPLRYDAGKADDHTLAALIACLQRVPGVVSASLEDHDY